MRILISNDDGIGAPGLAALVNIARDLGDITVVAPDSPQSAMAHSITLRQPLTVQYVRLPGEHAFEGMSVDGRPADCVRLAIRNLVPARPDLVLSGINAGANVGINVFYSGTVAAAAEGAMMGIPAVAFSADVEDGSPDFLAVARHCRGVLDRLLARGMQPGELISVNVPPLAAGPPRGVRVCEQSDADVDDTYVEQESAVGIRRYKLADKFDFNNPHSESDVALLRKRYITVTPLRVSLTDHHKLDELRNTCQDDTAAEM